MKRSMAKKFASLCKKAKANPNHCQISLQGKFHVTRLAYLILPVQRLPRYKV